MLIKGWSFDWFYKERWIQDNVNPSPNACQKIFKDILSNKKTSFCKLVLFGVFLPKRLIIKKNVWELWNRLVITSWFLFFSIRWLQSIKISFILFDIVILTLIYMILEFCIKSIRQTNLNVFVSIFQMENIYKHSILSGQRKKRISDLMIFLA
jgi:hypothetical protein